MTTRLCQTGILIRERSHHEAIGRREGSMDQIKSFAAIAQLRALLADLVDHVPIVIMVRGIRSAWIGHHLRERHAPAIESAGRLGRRNARRLAVLLVGICLVRVTAPTASAQDATAERHVVSAKHLVDQLALSNTDYAHGAPSVKWTAPVESHTDCSGFVDELLMHDDGYGADAFKRWFGSRRPTAERYHDAIVEGHGFERIASIESLRPGDFIAIKYLTRHDNTGHIMLVVEPPQSMRPSPPLMSGTNQWSVTVIDSSESGHGPTDTRHARGAAGRDHEGLGRGVFRLYATAEGGVAGFAWSTFKNSRFVAPDDEDVVLGRLIPAFQP
jgi:hypothetical protein